MANAAFTSLVSGTRQLLRWRVLATLHNQSCGIFLLVWLLQIRLEKATDWSTCWLFGWGVLKGAHRGKRQKAQSFYNEFWKIQAFKKNNKNPTKTERRLRKNLNAADKSQIKYFNGCDVSKGICLSVCQYVCVFCVKISMSTRVGVSIFCFWKTGNSPVFIFF